MKRWVFGFASMGLVLLLALSGCHNHYPEKMKYPVRSDPLVKNKELTQKATWPDPDRPGQLPILTMKDVQDERNPLYNPEDPSGKKLLTAGKLVDPLLIPAAQRELLATALNSLFGTPADPKVQVDETLVPGLSALKIDMPTLKEGSRLYRIHCLHCHGVPGDGRGPTARWINPHPRDFRQGIFKFQSVSQEGESNRPPRRDDLVRIIQNGIEGTAMPSFVVLKHEEIDAMVSYVIHLSIRGRAEFDTIKQRFPYDPDTNQLNHAKAETFKDDKKALLEAIFEDVQDYALATANKWAESQKPEMQINVPENPYARDEKEKFTSMLRGKLLFTGALPKEGEKVVREARKFKDELVQVEVPADKAKAANCVECHIDYGRRSEFRWDEWGTEVKPRNFTDNTFRGGRRPIDLYYRVHSGINGAGMQAYFGLKNETIWDLVNFVQAIGYPEMRKQLGVD